MTTPYCPRCRFWFTFTQRGMCPSCHEPTQTRENVARYASKQALAEEIRQVIKETLVVRSSG